MNAQDKKEYIRDLKNKPCTDCGVQYPFYIMQFDHVGEKLFNLSSAHLKFTIEEILDEISKCELVCANCHAERTWNRHQIRKQKTLRMQKAIEISEMNGWQHIKRR